MERERRNGETVTGSRTMRQRHALALFFLYYSCAFSVESAITEGASKKGAAVAETCTFSGDIQLPNYEHSSIFVWVKNRI